MPFSLVFWKIVFRRNVSIFDYNLLDPQMGKILIQYMNLVQKRNQILQDKLIDSNLKIRQLSNLKYNGMKIEEVGHYFVLPGTDIELKENGKNEIVTLESLD